MIGTLSPTTRSPQDPNAPAVPKAPTVPGTPGMAQPSVMKPATPLPIAPAAPGAAKPAAPGQPAAPMTADPLAFKSSATMTPNATPGMPSMPNTSAPPAAALPMAPAAPAAQAPASQIFANDPTRPGSGYVMQNGQPVRIEGTTAAGLGVDGQPKPVTAQDRYILDGGTLGDYVNPAAYNAFVNAPHGENTYTPAQQAVNAAPVSTTPHYLQNGVETGADGQPFTPSPMVAGGPNSFANDLGSQMTSLGLSAPGAAGGASDAQSPASGVGLRMPAGTTGAGSPSVTAPQGAVNLTPTDPNNPLTAQTITPGPMADRFGIANSRLDSLIHDKLDPQFEADQRRLGQNAAARGQVGSGMFRTSLGDLDLARQHDINAAGTGFLNDALNGSIGDAWNGIGLAERQQGFQAGQQQTAFNQNMSIQQLTDQLTNSSFGRSLQQALLGGQGDPSQIALILSQMFSGQAGAAGNAAANYGAASTANKGQDATTAAILKYLQGIQSQGQLNGITSAGIPGISTTPGGGY